MTLSIALATVACAAFVTSSLGAGTTGFTRPVSPPEQTNATEPAVDVDRSDGTVWAAWQGGGTHVARSDDGGRTWLQTPINDAFGSDVGDVDVAVGGPTPCAAATATCLPNTHRVYVSSLERLPAILQTHLAWSDDRGAHWIINQVAATNPSLIDRPWLAVRASRISAARDSVYIAYHDFSISQIWVSSSQDGGATFVQADVLTGDPNAEIQSFCDTIPSGIEVDRETGEIYVLWITADPVANTTNGCNLTQIENFHQVWIAHSANLGLTWDSHRVFDGPAATNTDKIFAALAVDDSGTPGVPGNVYAAFPDNLTSPTRWDIWFSRSTNRGATWRAPVKVNSDPGTHYFPWMAAGSTDRVDFLWLGSPDETPTDAEQSPWFATFAQTTNATAAKVRFVQSAASTSVMHVGDICTFGIFCTVTDGNRDLADSISVAIDRGGSAALVWTDQGSVLHGPTHITYGCATAGTRALAGSNQGLSCRGPAGP
ncbi:MAG: hypothetical protein ACJ761_10305 [Chloroflexota bacterium]